MNGKRYVGITSQIPERRWNNGKGYKASTRFYNAIKKYGWHNFKHEILYTNLNEKEAINIETMLIKQWGLTNKNNGYNMTAGGETHVCIGRKHSEETKRKIGNSHRGYKPTQETLVKLKLSHLNKGGNPVKMLSGSTLIAVFVTAAEAQRATGISATHICACCRNERKTAGGYVWKYA